MFLEIRRLKYVGCIQTTSISAFLLHEGISMLQVDHKCQLLQNPLKYKWISDSLRFENGKNTSLTDSGRKSYLSIYFIICGGIE